MKNSGCSISLDSLVLLTIVLVVLKATGYLGCSWWWVFAPLWLPVAIVAIILIGGLIGVVLAERDSRRNRC